MNNFAKLQEKVKEKFIGKTVYIKADAYYGLSGEIIDVKFQPIVDKIDEYRLHFVIDCNGRTITCREDETVIFIKR